jgi:flagellar hook-associated protein 1
MSDLLGIGTSALLAYRQALDITGQNIANANTPGYVRQNAILQPRPGTASGVEVVRINRNFDQILSTRALGDTASFSRLDSFSTLAGRLDALLSGTDTGLHQPLQDFFTALNTVAANPASVAAREVVLGSARALDARFADLQGQLDAQSVEINERIAQSVDEINSDARSIAEINQRIALATSSGAPPNDLLDQRDQMVSDIASRVGISTVQLADGTLNVYLGSGQALVLGARAYALATATDAFGSGALEVTYGGATLTSQLSGGSIGDPAYSQLGRLAVGLAETFNTQHLQGMDLNGQPGGLFFTAPSAQGLADGGNAGTAAVAIGFADPAQLGTGEYRLSYDGASWSLTRRDGQAVAMSGSGTLADPFLAEGLSFTISGSASAGDRFLLQPLRRAAGDLALAISDPRALAAAALPVSGAAPNSGDNTNIRALAGLSSQGILDGGRTAISAGYTALVSRTGSQAHGAQMSRDAAQAVLQRTQLERDSVSGVNLDEEAADLVRWQQAYQAAAQVIATANDLFETLLAATRR